MGLRIESLLSVLLPGRRGEMSHPLGAPGSEFSRDDHNPDWMQTVFSKLAFLCLSGNAPPVIALRKHRSIGHDGPGQAIVLLNEPRDRDACRWRTVLDGCLLGRWEVP